MHRNLCPPLCDISVIFQAKIHSISIPCRTLCAENILPPSLLIVNPYLKPPYSVHFVLHVVVFNLTAVGYCFACKYESFLFTQFGVLMWRAFELTYHLVGGCAVQVR